MLNWVERKQFEHDFLKKGYSIFDVKNQEILNQIRFDFVSFLRAQVNCTDEYSDEEFLNRFHEFVDPSQINELRVRAHKAVGASEKYRRLIFKLIETELTDLIGNEIAMQRQANFVFHFPRDSANLLYLHTDCWSGCSPYELILWLPLVDVYDTKSMFILDQEKNAKHIESMQVDPDVTDATKMREKVDKDIIFLNMKFGQALLFSPTLIHGADENITNESRFIINVRFKGLFSPYGTKSLGETFIPISFHPATELALKYEKKFGSLNEDK